MKKYIVLLFFGITVSLNAQWIDLDVPWVPQQQSRWCGVAASQSVIGYYKKPYTLQCEIMDYVRRCNIGMYGFTNCCPVNPLYCNDKGLNFFGGDGTGSVGDVLWEFGPVPTNELPGAFLLQQIIEQLTMERPIVVQWADFFGTIGHAVVIHGINGNNIKYVDPWNDSTGGFQFMSYKEFVDDGDVKWTNTLVTINCGSRGLPCHCYNGKHDAHLGEEGVDCGDVCFKACPPPPPPPPSKCFNCAWDFDKGEEGYDCGGPCTAPCVDVTEEKMITKTDQLYQKVMAYNKITAKGDVTVKSGKKVSFITEEEGSVVLLPGFHAERGSEFCTQRWEDLSGPEYSRICTTLCRGWKAPFFPFSGYWSHGHNKLKIVRLLYAKKITYEIVDRKENKVVYSNTLKIDRNGNFELWDFQTAITTQGKVKYRITFSIEYCNGDIIRYKNKFVVNDPPWIKYNMGKSLNEESEETENLDPPQSLSLDNPMQQDENAAPHFSILPNPNPGTFQLETNFSLTAIGNLKIINSLGATIYENQELTSNTIQLQTTATGTFFVVIILKDGAVLTRKMVIQR
ncbi:MAG: T9SS type A sorting domain-containing protein [Bacteroidetes bacterium]|nr:T9SS type A sorting domain-containing protein [Bacteroidota bacterium]